MKREGERCEGEGRGGKRTGEIGRGGEEERGGKGRGE